MAEEENCQTFFK